MWLHSHKLAIVRVPGSHACHITLHFFYMGIIIIMQFDISSPLLNFILNSNYHDDDVLVMDKYLRIHFLSLTIAYL